MVFTLHELFTDMNKCQRFVPRTQYGYLTMGLGIALVVLLIALISTWKWAQSEGKKRAEAEAQAQIWKQSAIDCSEATLKAQKDAEKRTLTARAALKKAREGSAKAETELERLRALRGLKPPSTCPAGEGVAAVRQGLPR